jgi:hypothetical protein
MKCILCLFDTKNPIIIDNQVYCIQCNDINNFAADINYNKILETKVIIEQLKTTNNNCIKCPKCKKYFSTKKCNCGYKNMFM